MVSLVLIGIGVIATVIAIVIAVIIAIVIAILRRGWRWWHQTVLEHGLHVAIGLTIP